ncbi:MAG: hypothetical protein HYY49_00425 [Ignavibacteriales bacterium]|nr:hypothetical protein [Ignavibacteriales bacterium]
MNNTTTSFGLYETFRILIPGFYFAILVLFFALSLPPEVIPASLTGGQLTILFLGLMIISGLTMYAKETTKKRKAFQENQPSAFLLNKARTFPKIQPLDDSEAQRLYFYILNNFMPAVFHEKIFFFGTVYHIMILVRRTSFWFGIVATAVLAARLSMGVNLNEQPLLVAFTFMVWAIYLLNVRYNKADRKMQENYRDQIFWLEMNNDVVEQLLRKRRTA